MRRALLLSLPIAATTAVVVGLVARGLPLSGLIAMTVGILLLPALAAARSDRAAAIAAGTAALIFGPLLAVPTYYVVHPTLHIDNAMSEAIDVWVDGHRTATISPNFDAREPPRLRLAAGKHRLAWSAVGAPVGLHAIDVDVAPLDDHLYSPSAAGCYWLSVTAYGGASTHGTEHGPLPVAEFHRFGRVDVWFGDTPGLVRAPRIRSGTLRVAIQRWHACMELAAIGCDPTQRASFVDCMRTIDGHTASSDCWQEAARTCPAVTEQSSVARPAHSAKP